MSLRAVRSLPDAPAPGETISMNMSVIGAMPGNTVDIASHLSFSATSDSFVAGDSRRRISLALRGMRFLWRPGCLQHCSVRSVHGKDSLSQIQNLCATMFALLSFLFCSALLC